VRGKRDWLDRELVIPGVSGIMPRVPVPTGPCHRGSTAQVGTGVSRRRRPALRINFGDPRQSVDLALAHDLLDRVAPIPGALELDGGRVGLLADNAELLEGRHIATLTTKTVAAAPADHEKKLVGTPSRIDGRPEQASAAALASSEVTLESTSCRRPR